MRITAVNGALEMVNGNGNSIDFGPNRSNSNGVTAN